MSDHAPQLDRAAVHSVDHFVFSVPSLSAAAQFYSSFGLDVRGNGNAIELRAYGNDHVWARIFQAGERKRLQYVSYGIYEPDLKEFAERVREQRLHADAHPHSDRTGIWLRDPDGSLVQLAPAAKVSPTAPTSVTREMVPLPGQGAAPSRSRAQQVHPRYLSHILQFTPDVPRMIAFCEEVLGLRLSDRSLDVIAFLHTPHGSDHHLVAFAKSHAPGLHHSSWDVGSVNEVGLGMEQMRTAGYSEGWGVGRHVLGSNYFNYVRDPWGSFCEYSSGIDYVPAGLAWPARDHPPEDSLYVWGPPVPQYFIENHEHPAGEQDRQGQPTA